MALGILLILFIVMSLISILGLILMYSVKSEGAKKDTFYAMAVWGMIIAVLGATSAPTNWIIYQVLSWIFGFMGIAGILVYMKYRSEGRCMPAYLLVTASVVLGMVKSYMMII